MEFLGNKICSVIGENVTYHCSLDAKMSKWKRKFEELNSRKEDVMSRAELQRGKNLKREVEIWLDNVQRMNGEKQSIENEIAEGRYFSRARLGKLVSEKIEELDELCQKGSFHDGLVADAPLRIGQRLPTTTLTGETTAKRKMEQVWDCLINDNNDRKIGVYGIGGVGKTTMVKHINNRILEETDLFDDVIWISASRTQSVFKLQNDIACALNQDLSKYKDVTIRAGKLSAILREERRYVLILDDIWEAFHLEDIGIPEPTPENGCKLVLTTRSLDICRSMSCKPIRMELLSKEEAWNLFLDKAGHDVLLVPNLQVTVKLIVEECACLPHAIITIARAMKGVVDICDWRNALEELRESTKGLSNMWSKVLQKLKTSYTRLTDKKLQDCLVFCALYPREFRIQRKELIEGLIAEAIIEGMKTRKAEFDRGHAMLNKLENACLLESVTDSNNNKCVKMNRWIREMVLQFASMNSRFMVEAGVKLENLPDEENWTEDLDTVSLMDNCISEIPSHTSPRCFKLSTLLFSRNRFLRRIPSSFFMHMHGLRSLNLSFTSIEHLPDSICDLESLSSISLRRCKQLRCMASFAKLKALKKLDLAYTGMEDVPQGMESLVNLRYLNLYMPLLRLLPAGLLPKLPRLQYLVVKWTSDTLKIKGEELMELRKLETFAGQFHDLHEYHSYVRSLKEAGPDKYLFRVGPKEAFVVFDDDYEEERYFNKDVILKRCSIGGGGGEDCLLLPKDVQLLQVEECHDVRSLCNVPSLNNATDLRVCEIINCDGLECLLSAPSHSCSPFKSLESLYLANLCNFVVLFKGDIAASPVALLAHSTFSCLKCLHISGCPRIKKLLMPDMLPCLKNLDEIRVSDCKGVEEIIAAGEEEKEEGMGNCNGDADFITINLPKLTVLSFSQLPQLKSICKGLMACDSLRDIKVFGCQELKRLPLFLPLLNGKLSPPSSFRKISTSTDWWEALQWEDLNAKNVLNPFLELKQSKLFPFDESGVFWYISLSSFTNDNVTEIIYSPPITEIPSSIWIPISK